MRRLEYYIDALEKLEAAIKCTTNMWMKMWYLKRIAYCKRKIAQLLN